MKVNLSFFLSGSFVDCHQVVQSGCLGYLLAALSSHQEEVRRAACHSLGRFSSHLSTSSVKEKQQVQETYCTELSYPVYQGRDAFALE